MTTDQTKIPWYKKGTCWLLFFLVIYLLFVGVGSAALVIVNFPAETPNGFAFPDDTDEKKPTDDTDGKTPSTTPKEKNPTDDTKGKSFKFIPIMKLRSTDQGLLLLALFAGVAGSFLHTAQSLSSYVGNASFKISWTTWYFLRPWIGGLLGFAVYFAFRAGLIAGASAVNPYGVVALGLLGGWFSKTTADKLQEVFETLFKTEEDKKRKDKLRAAKQPFVEKTEPPSIPTNANEIKVIGRNFLEGATVHVQVDGQELPAQSVKFVSDTELLVSLNKLQRPAAGKEALIQVKNPEGAEPLSNKLKLVFQ